MPQKLISASQTGNPRDPEFCGRDFAPNWGITVGAGGVQTAGKRIGTQTKHEDSETLKRK